MPRAMRSRQSRSAPSSAASERSDTDSSTVTPVSSSARVAGGRARVRDARAPAVFGTAQYSPMLAATSAADRAHVERQQPAFELVSRPVHDHGPGDARRGD